MRLDPRVGFGAIDALLRTKRRAFLGRAAALWVVLASAGRWALPRAVAAGSKKIGFELATYTAPRFANFDLPIFRKSAAALGYTTVSLQADSKVDQQVNDVQNLLSQQIGALTLMAVTGESGVGLVKQCKQAGVPVVAYNNEIPSADVSAYVGRDNAAVGVLMARGAQTWLGGKLKGNFVIASGHPGDGVAIGITEGCMQVLEPAIARGDVKLISQQYHVGWDPEGARRQVENALARTGNAIQAVLCNSDGLATGAIAALRTQGLAGKVYVCGLDATNEACRLILTGELTFDVFTRCDEMARQAAQLSVQLAQGKAISSERRYPVPGGGSVPYFPAESYVINRDNMVEYLRRYSPGYVDARVIFRGIPAERLPQGAQALLEVQ
jgi:D-xylose transport system substrate-binding protein